MNRRRALAAVVLSGVTFAVACSFPDVTFNPVDAGTDGTLSDGGTTGDGGSSVTIDSSGPCPDGKKRCGVACTNIYDPTHGCGAAPPACDPCPGPSHTTSTCTFPGASCNSQCEPPWQDCDNDASNGCEADPTSGDGQNCGRCGKVCDAGTFCAAGNCGASCGTAGVPCGTSCIDPTKDPKNCGGCGKTCDAGDNQTPLCQGSTCTYQCAEGWGDCDGKPGCEAKLGSVDTCGRCDNKCYGGNNTGASCEDGGCVYGCLNGFSDCNADLSDGCECAAPKVCRSGACVTCKPAGQGCQKGSECCSGNCPGVLNALGICIGCTCQ